MSASDRSLALVAGPKGESSNPFGHASAPASIKARAREIGGIGKRTGYDRVARDEIGGRPDRGAAIREGERESAGARRRDVDEVIR